MKTLTINMIFKNPEIRLTGLSFKKIQNTNIEQHIIKSDTGWFCIESDFNINGKTARIELQYLVNGLAEIYECLPFEKIKIIGNYEVSSEELMLLIKKRYNYINS